MLASNELKAARIRRNYSQEKLAKYIGLGKTSYSKRENGIVSFTVEEVSKISEVLNLSNEEIIYIFFNEKVALKTTKSA